ncbi:UDP-N-acetylglucosamine 1-carboxyvinyltransferase [Patescibacteria group bacterium]|nr:UDP-N-acetylglucosamine 1-carboxyvinyltransferase [Patescibacteria group bacterium]MBU4142742.1 UDP-N-acetylglucosamine 1-carboxyvinyltransferase [Patescibacteria group bacterium]
MQQKFIINGQKPLAGSIKVKGAKNAALKVFPLALMTDEPIRVVNVPDIEDCHRAQEMLAALGHSVKILGDGQMEIQRQNKTCLNLPADLVNKFRSSVMFVGPLLVTCGEVHFPHPGGCVIGATRPIDMFLDGFAKMGARVERLENSYRLTAPKLQGAFIFFPKVTVTGTESLMTTACLAQGETVLENCAMEPEIPALAGFLNKMGAKITGAGTPTIKIAGVKKLGGGEYQIIPDRIEAGTFAILAAAVNSGEVVIANCEPKHLGALWALFDRVGVNYKLGKNSIKIFPSAKIIAEGAVTHEYPGFATDLQSAYTVLMTQAHGLSLIHETIYDRRLLFCDTLTQMGANIIMADPHRSVVNGPTKLYGRKLVIPDLRAGIALVIAALIAKGKTEIDNIYQIERGYEKLAERLKNIGADIEKI